MIIIWNMTICLIGALQNLLKKNQPIVMIKRKHLVYLFYFLEDTLKSLGDDSDNKEEDNKKGMVM